MTTISRTETLDILEGTFDECRAHAESLGMSLGRGHGAVIGILGGKAIHSPEISAYDLERGGKHAGMLQKLGNMWEIVIRKGF